MMSYFTLTKPSDEPEAINLPSGLAANVFIYIVWPFNVAVEVFYLKSHNLILVS